MCHPDDPQDLADIQSATGNLYDSDFWQCQAWKVLSGGGYYQAHRTFVDEMWAAYRFRPELAAVVQRDGALQFTILGADPRKTNYLQATSNLLSTNWSTLRTNAPSGSNIVLRNFAITNQGQWYYRVKQTP
jgi:hypothetical protein